MSKEYKVIHKKSNVVNDGAPKLPQASLLEYGEIAVNYGVSGETLSIKNSADQIVTFPSRDIIDRMVEGKGYLTGYTETDPTVPSWAKEASKPSYTASEVGAMATSERGNYLTTATTIPSIAGLVASVDYDSTGKTIVFYDSSDNVVDSIDATDFIKDGMVDSVAIATPTGGTNSGVTCLVVTFNTDAGKEDIEIPLSNIFNPANYYNKTQADQTFLSQSAYTEDEEVVATALNDLNDRIENIYVPSDISEFNNDADFITSAYTGFSSTGHTHSQYSTTAHTHTAAEVGAMATSERSNYSTTAHTHTAAEVGAISTADTGNFLTTAATLDNVADGTTRKLSNYLTTGTTLDNVADGTTRKLANYSLTSHTHTAAEVGAISTAETGNFLTTAATASDVGAMATSERGNYLTTATTIPTTAAEVGAMATSERSNYLPTGTTLDNVADGSTRKLSDYSTTGHSHTAAEVGAMATGERSNYLTTATTIPTTAAEVGAMATSERSNYLPTGTTLDNVADGSTRKLSDYSLTSHTHTAAEVGAMATSERSNYSTTAHTHDQYSLTSHTHDIYSTTAHTHSQYISGLTFNGTAVTVTNGVAAITGNTLPAVTSSDNGKVMMVVEGAWALVTPTTVYTGSNTPQNSMGNDGDIYLQTE